ncbi:hypothetical protein [Pigmentiphaga kullae]|uniref:Uncharacterized protein n=1 Tax=Pigmentiphaga kullae TaxID=151784 RepID=A0A4V2F300_9BURK|nr:hypothetical protein [Pigmentiphaga kullae]RZS80664.1 hypothetical protein EV675_3276 [Pigmentiphaga kullae]
MRPIEFIRREIDKGLCLLPDHMDSREAVLMLLAISGQESNWEHRWQIVDKRNPSKKGPGRSFWQGEMGGGMVHGVRTHRATRGLAAGLYAHFSVPASDEAIWTAIETNDPLAAALARLLLYTDPDRLPKLSDEEGAWQYYLRLWRPGAWTNGTPAERADLRQKWEGYYAQALAQVSP